MKKFTKTLLLTIGLLVGFTVNAHAVSVATLTQTDSGYWYDRAKADGSDHHSWHYTLYDIDREVAYCIQPNTKEGVNYNQGTWEDVNLPNSIKERLLLIGYYGYTYPGHQTLQYRAATQGMMWDLIVGSGANTTFHTARWGKGDTFDVSNEKAQIENLIAHHYDRPSFNGGVYKAQVGETITLTDTNNVLSNYSVSVSGADYNIDGNKLIIKPTQSGNIDLTLSKKMPYNSGYKFFVGDGFQHMMVPGTTDPVIAKVRVNSYTSFVEGHKKDSETGNAQGQATLKGAEYGVYETSTGRLVTTVVTDENGYFKSNAVLSWNDYYLQEIKPSEGYELDTTRYNVDIKGKEFASVNVVEKVIKNYVSILKQYEQVDGNTTFLNAEKDITFEIYYPNGNKYGEIKTDKNGYTSLNLPYGVWKFHQVNTTTGYEKIYDFYITVNETSEKEQYYNILNNTLYAYLQVIKVDSETGKAIAIANTTFKILNTDTNQYVSQYVGGKVYSEFKTDENGKMITYLKLPAGNYKLIEVSAPNGYLKDKDGLKFTIGNDTHYSYTTYGAFITVTYKNTPIKGQLEVKKTGENLVIKDGKYTYKDKKLSGVTFEIYAEEDIKSADGNHLYYEKGTKVDTITTDKNGYAISKKLPLGKYYLIEVKTQDEYVLDSNKHYFELKEVNDETPIVFESYSNLNFLKKGTLEFTKTDLVNGDVIPDTIIEIYNENDELIFTGKTDKDGKVIITDLKVGKYYIIEKEAATGYTITDEKIYFELKENGEITKAEMKDKPITGTLEFTKTDVSTGEPLPNTLIEIYNEKDELIFSGRTDENGKITIPEIRYGKYYILEKEAPKGYTLNPERMYFEILEDGKVVKATMTDEKVVAECNQEFADRLQNIQDENPHDDYILEGTMASWKDVLLVYTIKESKGVNDQEVMTMNEEKKKTFKEIFWNMNNISSEVKTERVTEQGINTNELPKEVEKRVLHIKLISKTAEQMKMEYSFNANQLKQYNELSSQKYAALWNGAIYGNVDSGEYISWRQNGQSWSNIKIGNTNSTLGQIGCLVTSISILIEKSGCNTTITPFNPGTFLEALNANNAFDINGNLQYAGVTKAVPNFKYGGNVNLRGKSRTEKLALITQYYNQGYYLTIEVKGATPGNQHWVAITGVNGNNVNIVDPGSNGTDLWSSYEWSKSSQFNYFMVN